MLIEQITVEIDGDIYGGWKRVELEKAIDEIAGAFSFEFTDAFSDDRGPFPIYPGLDVQIFYGKRLVATGYIDITRTAIGPDTIAQSFSGRDITADLVDCSVADYQEYKNISLNTLAQRLARPFDIIVVPADDPGENFSVFKIEPGESPFSAIERAARLRGKLIIPFANGNLIITDSGVERASTALREGINIKSIEAVYDQTNRYSDYTVLGQQTSPALDAFSAKTRTEIKETARDSLITRDRPKIIIAEGPVDKKTAKTRAQWEASVALGQSQKINVEVVGWGQENKDPWAINELVSLSYPSLEIEEDLLIAGVNFSYTPSGGTVATLTLVHQQAYKPKPVVKQKNINKSELAALGWSF